MSAREKLGKEQRAYLNQFRSLFKGREDVFAIRWEKGNKSGYMPAYQYDRYLYQLHKRNGGTFKEYKDKTYLPLKDHDYVKHLKGQQFIGIYPLLKDNYFSQIWVNRNNYEKHFSFPPYCEFLSHYSRVFCNEM